MNKLYNTSKETARSQSVIQGKTENKPASEVSTQSDPFNYDAYDETDKNTARIAITHEQLVQGIILSEIIGPPVAIRNRFGKKQ